MSKRLLAVLVAALTLTAAAVVSSAPPAAGAAGDTHVVDTTADDPDADTNDGVCLTAAGECSLRAALEQAQADHVDGVTTTVQVPAGTYELTGGHISLFNVNVVVKGAGAGQTIVVAGGEQVTERHLELSWDEELVVTLEDMTFRGGQAFGEGGSSQLGGSILSQGATLTIRRMHFEDNEAEWSGGAIYAEGIPVGDTLVVDDTTFAGNVADVAGGAIHVGGDEIATITNSTFTDNQAALGGALAVGDFETSDGGDVTVTHATFSGNRAMGPEDQEAPDGGGTIAVSDEGAVTLTGSIVEDTTELDEGQDSAGAPIANCLLHFGTGTLASGGFNVVDDDSCNATAGGDQPDTAAGVLALADNGGPTFTMALTADSPAVDAAGANCGLSADQRGIARPQDGDGDGTNGCDSGAFELAAVEVPPTTPPPAEPVPAAPSFTG